MDRPLPETAKEPGVLGDINLFKEASQNSYRTDFIPLWYQSGKYGNT